MPKKPNKKALSILLAFAMLICSSPYVSAENTADFSDFVDYSPVYAEDAATHEESAVTKELKEKAGLGVVEIESLRDKYTKHFQISDGTYQAVTYDYPVHRLDANGNWQDIDNRLYKKNGTYTSTDSRTVFSTNIKPENMVMIHDGDYQISMGVQTNEFTKATVKATAVAVTNPKEKAVQINALSDEAKLEALTDIDNTTHIHYENVYAGADLEYTLFSDDISEQIIIQKYSNDYEYSFNLSLDGLTAVLLENGDVALYDIKTDTRQYTMPAPYMRDSNGNISYNVQYDLNKQENGTYVFSINADRQWIESDESAFPIIVYSPILPDVKYSALTLTVLIRQSIMAPLISYGLAPVEFHT